MLKRAVYLCNTNKKLSEVWDKLELLPRYLYFTYIYHYLPNCAPLQRLLYYLSKYSTNRQSTRRLVWHNQNVQIRMVEYGAIVYF